MQNLKRLEGILEGQLVISRTFNSVDGEKRAGVCVQSSFSTWRARFSNVTQVEEARLPLKFESLIHLSYPKLRFALSNWHGDPITDSAANRGLNFT